MYLRKGREKGQTWPRTWWVIGAVATILHFGFPLDLSQDAMEGRLFIWFVEVVSQLQVFEGKVECEGQTIMTMFGRVNLITPYC